MITVKIKGALPDVRALARDLSRRELRRAMFDAKPAIEKGLQASVKDAFKTRGTKFARSFKGWVEYKDDSRMPVAVFKWVIPWSGVFATGGSVSPRAGKWMIMPINTRGERRIKPALFREFLHREYHNISWHPAPGGRYLLTYERHRDEASMINKFKLTSNGKRRIDVPIAVAVPSVQLDRRIDLDALTQSLVLPEILRRIGE